MLLSNNLTCIFMTSFGYLVLFFPNHFIFICFFVDVYLHGLSKLETYTYERGHLLVGILILLSYLVFIYNSLVAPFCLMSACLIVYWYPCTLMYFLKIFVLMPTMVSMLIFLCLNALTSFCHFQLVLVSNWYP